MADNGNFTASTAANDIADIVMTGRARQEDPNAILEQIWDTAGAWVHGDPLDGVPSHLVAEATEFMRDARSTYARTMPATTCSVSNSQASPTPPNYFSTR